MTDTPPLPQSVPYVPGRLGQEAIDSGAPSEPPTGSQPLASTPPPRRSRTPLLIGGLTAVVLALAGAVVVLATRSSDDNPEVAASPSWTSVFGTVADGSNQYRISGAVSLSRSYDGMTSCGGSGGFKDIRAGAQVVISDSAGTTVAIGRLEVGTVTSGRGCVLPFTVANVPAGKGFYGIEVSHRGVLRYAEAEISTRELDLTLG